MNIREYVAERGIRVEVVEDKGILRGEDGWEHRAFELRMTDNTGATMDELPWMQGLGITTEPDDEPWTVLDALASDAHSYLDARSFEDWAESLGYDTDSRKAERTYRECERVAEKLTAFLGGETERDHLLYEVERD